MTLVLIDGYDYLPVSPTTVVMSAQAWSGNLNTLIRSTDTAFGYGYSLSHSGLNVTNVFSRSARGRYETGMVWGMRVKLHQEAADTYGFRVTDSQTTGGSVQWYIEIDVFGCISFYNYVGSTATLRAKTPSWSFYPGVWFYLEIKWTPGYSTDGSIEVRVNTVPVLSLPAIRTANGAFLLPATGPGFDILQIITGGPDGNRATKWDDWYLLTQDGPRNNDYLGNTRAKYMAPVSNGSPLQWTIGGSSPAATNWQSVLNIALNDTRYVYASTVGYQDLYGIDPNLNTPQVFGVEVSGAYRQDDATQRFVLNTIQSGSSSVDGIAHATNQNYNFFPDIYELNPDTGVAFTGAEVNGLLIGPKVDT